MSLLDATNEAIAAAPHLTDPRYLGSLQALRMLAAKADQWQKIVDWAVEDLADQDGRKRPAVPQNDNVTLASYARLSEQLGLTPIGRKALDGVGGANGGKPASSDTDTPTEGGTSGKTGKLGLITPIGSTRGSA